MKQTIMADHRWSFENLDVCRLMPVKGLDGVPLY